jgi:hypothetical protein
MAEVEARILRCGSFGQHCGLSGYGSQSSLLRAIEQRVAVVYCAARSELLSVRALVDIRSRVVSEVVE